MRSAVVLSLAALAALAGCGAEREPTPDPAARVAAAARALDGGSFAFRIETPGYTVTGVRHRPSDRTRLTVAGDSGNTAELFRSGDQVWLKQTLPRSGDLEPDLAAQLDELEQWQETSLAGARTSLGGLATTSGGAIGAELVTGIAGLAENSPGTFTGTLDLTTRDYLDIIDEEWVDLLDQREMTVPITVTVDGAGRLSSVAFDIPTAEHVGPQRATITFADFDRVAQPPVAV